MITRTSPILSWMYETQVMYLLILAWVSPWYVLETPVCGWETVKVMVKTLEDQVIGGSEDSSGLLYGQGTVAIPHFNRYEPAHIDRPNAANVNVLSHK